MHGQDEEIVRRVQRGERSEYLKIFDRYYPRIENYALQQLRDAEAARDVASETFLRAYRNVDAFRLGEQITYLGFLFLICRRLILTEHKRSKRAQTVSWEQLEQESQTLEARDSDVDTLPLAHLLQAERRQMVQTALGRLSPDDREIILLAFERDLSRRDIAQVLNKPSVSAVTSHLHRAMQKLKAVLMEQGYFFIAQEAEQPRT